MDTQLQSLIGAVKAATKEWLSPKELYQEYGISTSTQAKMRVSKSIPFHKISKYVRYKRDDINLWFDKAKVV